MNHTAEEIYSKLGANEHAIVDKIKNKGLRDVVIRLIGIKLQLQWTGWLQFIIPVPITLTLFLISLIAYVLGGSYIADAFAILGSVLALMILLDIITIKYQIRFPEAKPKRNEDKDVFELMLMRRSCRSYQKRQLTKEDYNAVMRSVEKHMKEPMFSDEPVRFEYIATPIRVWPVVNAKEFLVAIAPKAYNRLSILDVGRTLQKVVIDATRLGVASCWIGAGADHKSVIAQLGERFDPEKENIVCICALGYESHYVPLFIRVFSRITRKRRPLKALFYNDLEMREAIDVQKLPYSQFHQTFASCQYAPSSYNGQTTRGIITVENNTIERIDFVAVTASRYYAAVATGIWCANWEMGCEALQIPGHFKQLSDQERGLSAQQKASTPPVYEMSWILDERHNK